MGSLAGAMSQFRLLLLLSTLVGLIAGQCDPLPNGDSCEGHDDEEFADPEDCSSYYKCEAGCAKHMKCERNFLFDTFRGFCNYPLDVDCGERPCTDPSHCYTTTTSIPTTTTEDCGHLQDCKELGEGYHPDPYNCRKYWHCVAGRSEHILCDDGMYYDPVNVWCDYPERVQCGSRPICDECDHDCVTAAPTPAPTADCGHILNCTDLKDGWYPDPYNCRKYWHCLKGNGVHYMCEDDLLYSPVNIWCDYADKVDCGERPICGPCDEDCVTPPPTTQPCDHIMDCSHKPDGWYADPYNCRKYWHCEHGQGKHYMCKDELLYDPIHIWCNYPDKVSCGARPICDECDQNCR